MVSDQNTYRARLLAVDLAGSCKVEIEGSETQIRGKITDPALSSRPNPYTHALDTGEYLMITGKPVMRKDEISTLYISNAVPSGDAVTTEPTP